MCHNLASGSSFKSYMKNSCFDKLVLSKNFEYRGFCIILFIKKSLAKEIKCEAGQAFYCFFAAIVMNSIIDKHKCLMMF